MDILGRHLLIDLFDCDSSLISNSTKVKEIMIAAATDMNARVVEVVFHHFNPHGVSGVVVIAESHLTIHTWPEHNLVSIDVFTCGDDIDPWKAFHFLFNHFGAGDASTQEIQRGLRIQEETTKQVFKKAGVKK